MKKRMLCALLMLVLSISACSEKKDDVVVANVGTTPITMSEFKFYLNNVKEQMQGTELSDDEDWENMEIDGKKAIEVAKEQALHVAARNIASIELYEKLGNEVTKEDKERIRQYKKEIVSEYDANGGYDEFLKTSDITDEFVDKLCESTYYTEMLFNKFSAEYKISDDAVKKYFDEHSKEYNSTYRRAKHVLILTKNQQTNEELSEEEKQKAKIKAEDILKRAKKGEDFDSLVKEFSQDPGSIQNPNGYTFGDGEMVEEFEKCVDSLGFDEIGFCQSTFGYHIIKRLPLDESEFAESIKYALASGEFGTFIERKMVEFNLIPVETEEIKNVF